MRIIINNKTTNLTDLQCLDLVKLVIDGGRISENKKAYCFLTVFTYNIVTAKRNKNSDSFTIVDKM